MRLIVPLRPANWVLGDLTGVAMRVAVDNHALKNEKTEIALKDPHCQSFVTVAYS
mgnify:CR=1 FL=1